MKLNFFLGCLLAPLIPAAKLSAHAADQPNILFIMSDDLAVLPDGTVLCFYENGTDMPKIKRKRDWAYANLTLARFNLEWLTTR